MEKVNIVRTIATTKLPMRARAWKVFPKMILDAQKRMILKKRASPSHVMGVGLITLTRKLIRWWMLRLTNEILLLRLPKDDVVSIIVSVLSPHITTPKHRMAIITFFKMTVMTCALHRKKEGLGWSSRRTKTHLGVPMTPSEVFLKWMKIYGLRD